MAAASLGGASEALLVVIGLLGSLILSLSSKLRLLLNREGQGLSKRREGSGGIVMDAGKRKEVRVLTQRLGSRYYHREKVPLFTVLILIASCQ